MWRYPSCVRLLLAVALPMGPVGGLHAQPVLPPPPDRQIEYQIEGLRLSVPLKLHPPRQWDDPPKGNAFRPYPNALDVMLMWPNLSDATAPESQRCIERVMMGACRDAIPISIHGRSEFGDQVRRSEMMAAKPAIVGILHGFEVSRRTTPIPPESRFRTANAYLRIVDPDMGDPAKIEGSCGGLWRETVPETLPEIERQMLICLFRYQLTDKIVVSISTFGHGLAHWKQLYARLGGLLQEWQRAAR